MNPLQRLLQDPEWILIENLISDQISKMLDIREIDETISAEDMKIEIRARQIAVKQLMEFYSKNHFMKRKIEEIPVTFE